MTPAAKPSFGKRAPSQQSNSDAPETAFRPIDKRSGDRASVFKNAQVFLPDGAVLDCIAKNLSADGCLLSVTGAEGLPDELTIRLDPVTGMKHAKVVWREGGEAGIQFTDKA